MIRVVVVDDHRQIHELVALALATTEDIVIVGQGSNGEEAVRLTAEHQPDLVLLDVVMPGTDGVHAAQQIRAQHPGVRILVLSSFQDDDTIQAMLGQDVDGYILKYALAEDLIPTIRAAHAGNLVFSREIARRLTLQDSLPILPVRDFNLTEREREVLQLMAGGLNNNEIAKALYISASTVKFHLTNILEKMGVHTRAEAIVMAAKNNLV